MRPPASAVGANRGVGAPTVVTRAATTRSTPPAAPGAPTPGRTPAAGTTLRARAAAVGDTLTRPWTPLRVAWWAGGALVAGGSVGAVGGLASLLLAG